MRNHKSLSFAAAMLCAPAAFASTLDAPLPDNAYITVGALDWAWAAPCAAESPSCGVVDLTYQSQFGWRLPTLEEFQAAAITAINFVFDGANVPQNGRGPNGASFTGNDAPGDAACAAIYFSTEHDHCDWANGVAGNWDILAGQVDYWDTLVVRETAPLSAIPVPAGMPLVLTGIGALGWLRRKSKRT